MPRRNKTLEERVVDLERLTADQAALIEEIYVLLSAESVWRLHDKGHSVKEIARLMGRPDAYVRRVLRNGKASI